MCPDFCSAPVCGLAYGALSAASMIPLSISDKGAALADAFLNRFAIGFRTTKKVASP